MDTLELKQEIVNLSNTRQRERDTVLSIEAEIEELEWDKEEAEYRLYEADTALAVLREKLAYMESTTPEQRLQDKVDERLTRHQRRLLKRRYGTTNPQSIRDYWTG